MTTYDQAKLIDDAWAARDVAEARADTLKEKLETTAYIFVELLKNLGYTPAKNINEPDCVGFVETLIEDHGCEDDAVEAIVKALQPVDTEDPGVSRPNPWIEFQDLYGFDDETQSEMKRLWGHGEFI